MSTKGGLARLRRRELHAVATLVVVGAAITPANGQTADTGSVQLGTIPVTAPAGGNSADYGTATPESGGMYVPRQSFGPFGDVNAQDLPLSTFSVPQALIQDQMATNLQDVLKNVPGVATTINQTAAPNAEFQIRGFNVGSTPQAFRQDGMAIGNNAPLPAEATERVDVYEGLDAILYGFGEPGGVINTVTKKPLDAPLTRFTESFENNGVLEEAIDISRRFGRDNQFGVRLNLATQNGYGPVDNYHIGRSVYDLSADWKPIPGLRVFASVDQNNAEYKAQQTGLYLGGDGFVYLPPAPNPTRNYGEPWFYSRFNTLNTQGGVEYKNDDWHFLGALGYTRILFAQEDSGAGNSSFVGDGTSESYLNQAGVFTHDGETFGSGYATLSRRIDTSPVVQTLQASYSKTVFDESLNNFAAAPFGQTSFENNLLVPYSVPNPQFQTGKVTIKESSAYENLLLLDSAELYKRVILSGGVAISSVETGIHYPGIVRSHTGEAAMTPNVSLVVHATPTVNVYGSYVQGLQPGGTVGDSGALNYLQVLPSYISEQVEFGVKAQVRPGLNVTAAVFQESQALQALQFVTPTTYNVTEKGSQVSNGLQTTVAGKPVDNVAVFGGVTVLRSIGHKTGDPESDGLEVIGVPDWTANLTAQYMVPWVDGLKLLATANHVDQVVLRNSGNRLPAYTTLDLGATYSMSMFDHPTVARIYMSNVTGSRYWTPGLSIGDPFVLKASLQVDF